MKKIQFNIHYRTAIGESLFIKIKELGTGKVLEEELDYVYDSIWRFGKEIKEGDAEYHFLVKDVAGRILNEEMNGHLLSTYPSFDSYCIFDSWNNKNFPENYLNNKIIQNALKGREFQKIQPEQKESHLFTVQAPLYNKDEKVVLLGSASELGNWDLDHCIEMHQTDIVTWEVFVDLSDNIYVEYKYAILNIKTGEIVYENGSNRKVRTAPNPETLNVLHDHYFKFPVEKLWRAAGVAVPVFSLRSENSFGVGEFADLKLLADWAAQTKLSMLQILPINDTTATHQWTDSYPYAAISVYALHPQYLSLGDLTYPLS